jgi:hypothetical protein
VLFAEEHLAKVLQLDVAEPLEAIKGVELVGALLRLSRRLMVPACLGHLSYLVPALWIEHRLAWFAVGPGENGTEFPLTIIVGTVACILAYAPKRATSAAPGEVTSSGAPSTA